MISYMLDTKACIALIKDRPDTMRLKLQEISTHEVAISSVVAAELWYGVALSRNRKINEAALKDFLDYMSVLDWPHGACPMYGRIRAELKKKGTPIGAMDLLIASHALFLDAVIVTNNTGEFLRVPGLKVEDWQA